MTAKSPTVRNREKEARKRKNGLREIRIWIPDRGVFGPTYEQRIRALCAELCASLTRTIPVICVALFLSGCASSDVGRAFDLPSQVNTSAFEELGNDHSFPAWSQAVERIVVLPQGEQLQAVNDFVNGLPVSTMLSHEWVSPRYLAKNGGVCHDFAFAKHEMLAEMGWPRDSLRIVALFDGNKSGEGHAVLVVKSGGKYMVLDNLSKPVLVNQWSQSGYRFIGQPSNFNGHVELYMGNGIFAVL